MEIKSLRRNNKMKYLSFISLFALVLSGPTVQLKDSDLAIPQEMIDEINRVQDSWIASSKWVGNMTIAEAKHKASTISKPRPFPAKEIGALSDYLSIPASFDARTKWPNCIHPIRNDDLCDAGWAFGATETLSDRFCIASNGKINIVLSPLYLIVCDISYDDRCSFGSPDSVWNFMKNYGVPTESCLPYNVLDTDEMCPNSCWLGNDFQFYKAATVNSFNGTAAIQAEILANGPVEVIFTMYQDLLSYKGGIYKHTTGDSLGTTCVKVVGWGNQSGTNYWIAANSWGTRWGLQGYFWIAFGEGGIGKQAVAGTPYIKGL
ncbi:unnamed protein product [Blepharisma stoltei]|uniref:Peptidase C1A papain C-terminal domain-containing protein n=1 Tax=Blepharisma stoltei TaxID=1481888 RepID=A0AAU9IKF6_9CILI|nr:unnamed protein product [Blepharisma stoltei]